MAPKAKSDKFKQFMESADIPQSTENALVPSIPGGIETLLDVSERKPLPALPEQGRRCILYDIIQYTPETYAQMIVYVRNGAYYHTAAESVGIASKTLYDWCYKGRRDAESGIDSYYSRLYKDIRKATAQCRVSKEMAIADIDPKKWLNLGPGKMFGTEWVELPTSTADLVESENPFLIESTDSTDKPEEVNQSKDAAKTKVIDVNPEETLQAMKALEDAGLITLSEEYKKELNN